MLRRFQFEDVDEDDVLDRDRDAGLVAKAGFEFLDDHPQRVG